MKKGKKGDGPPFMSSVDGLGDALDALDSDDGLEGALELSSDGLVRVVDEESRVDLHEAESDGRDLGLKELDSGGKDGGEALDDCLEVDVGALGHEVVACNNLSHLSTSRSDESAFLAFVGNALVAALVAPSDLALAALGAFEEGVAVPDEPLTA